MFLYENSPWLYSHLVCICINDYFYHCSISLPIKINKKKKTLCNWFLPAAPPPAVVGCCCRPPLITHEVQQRPPRGHGTRQRVVPVLIRKAAQARHWTLNKNHNKEALHKKANGSLYTGGSLHARLLLWAQ